VQDRIADTNVIVDETLQGIQNVKAFANEAMGSVALRRSVVAAVRPGDEGRRWRGAFVSFIILCMFGAIVLVIWRGVHLMALGEISTGELVTFIMYSVFIGASIGGLPECDAGAEGHRRQRTLMDLHDEPPNPSTWRPKGPPLPSAGAITSSMSPSTTPHGRTCLCCADVELHVRTR
jgi:ABC-type multidrug transport system fused ATPase/permease subunit